MAENVATSGKLWNFANVVTTFRLILAPVFIVLFLQVYHYGNDSVFLVWFVAVLYMVGAATDMLDGYWARKYDLVTNYGKIVDPIADKFLVLGAFVVLSYVGFLPWYFTVVVALRDFVITALRFALLKDIVIAASVFGKWKTFSQMMLIWLYVFPFHFLFDVSSVLVWVIEVVYWLALGLTVYSFLDYLVLAWRGVKLAKAERGV